MLALFTALNEDDPDLSPSEVASSASAPGSDDPFAYDLGDRETFERRAAAGNSHVIYEKSPGGVVASAERTNRFRAAIEGAAAEHDIDPELMEAMVLLESAGRSQVIAGDDPEAASGLAQILASTATDLLDMRVDLARSRDLTERIGSLRAKASRARHRAVDKADPGEAAKLNRKARRLERRAREARELRAQVDERFDPTSALEGMGRYLRIAGEEFGRDDLAITSYHMGIGNLTEVIRRYTGSNGGEIDELVDDEDIHYAQLYFDSSPLRNPDAWSLLSSLGDDSSTYYWRVLAAAEIMRLWRDDRERLDRLIELHAAKATAEEVFHPEGETTTFADPQGLADGLDDGLLIPIPPGAGYGYEIGPQLGELAAEIGAEPGLYAALRPEALATLIYMTARVRTISGAERPLTVTSAVRDRIYQESLRGRNAEATAAYSLHTTGYSFDIRRQYQSGQQAEAFQFALDRLKSLSVIDYAREPAAIHITVSDLGRLLLG